MDNRSINTQISEARRLTEALITNFFGLKGHMRSLNGNWAAADEVARGIYRRLCEIEIATQNEIGDEGRC